MRCRALKPFEDVSRCSGSHVVSALVLKLFDARGQYLSDRERESEREREREREGKTQEDVSTEGTKEGEGERFKQESMKRRHTSMSVCFGASAAFCFAPSPNAFLLRQAPLAFADFGDDEEVKVEAPPADS